MTFSICYFLQFNRIWKYVFDANQIHLINPINLTLNIKIYISCGAECAPSISEIRLTGLQIFHRMILYMKHNFLHEIWIGLNTRQSNYMQTGKVEYKPVNIEDLTIVRTQCIPLIKSTQILSGDIC